MSKFGVNLSENYWDKQWLDKFDHYQNDKRFAYYVRAILNKDENKLLEIAAGSFRDVATLNNWGYDCCGIDFSAKSIKMAKEFYSNIEDKICFQDAFSMSSLDKCFDLSYHNGLWGYFENDDIENLLKEQIRVTKKRVVATVHNAHNAQFVDYFKRLTLEDPLYNIRFFQIDEMKSLMSPYCKSVEVIPVGKGKKFYEDDLINIGLGDAKNIKKSFDFHGLNLLESSERLLCIGTI